MFFLLTTPTYAADYFVKNSGNDSNTGLSDAQAWATISKVNSFSFQPNDTISFNRGDLWREQLVPVSGTSSGRVTYKAYGTGALPIITTSKEENSVSDWVDQGSNIWQNSDSSFTVDIGNIIFDEGASYGIKVFNEGDVDSDLEFWYDEFNDLIKIYSTSNPASRFSDIECARFEHIVNQSGKSYINYEDLNIKYGGSHGIDGGGTDNITIRNSHFQFIGGADQFGGQATTRFGNAIQIWEMASNIVVEKNLIDQIYDAAITTQGLDESTQSNIVIRNNIITNSEYSFEHWLRPASSTINGLYVENNIGVDAGSGWAHSQRPTANGTHVMIFSNTATTTNAFIRNNIFSNSTEYTVRFADGVDVSDFTLDYNLFYETSGNYGRINGTNYGTFAAYQAASSQDANSVSGNPLVDINYKPTSGSPAIDAGLTVANVTDDYLGVTRPQGSAYDIGAYETIIGINLSGVTFSGITIN